MSATHHCNLDKLQTNRDRLWVEAVVRYRQGEPWYLADENLAALAMRGYDVSKLDSPR